MFFENFEPISLRVERIGPFEQEFCLSFLKNVNTELSDYRPAKIFLLASQNGKGKTTLLEAFASAINLLSSRQLPFSINEDFFSRKGRIQLDIRATVNINSISNDIILSLVNGDVIFEYSEKDLDKLNAPHGQEFIIARSASSQFNKIAQGSIAKQILLWSQSELDIGFNGLFNEELLLPTTLFFTADRSIARPPLKQSIIAKPDNLRYYPCHIFGREEGSWKNSIDNLLCWFTWLSSTEDSDLKSYFNKACNLINEIAICDENKRLRLLQRDPPAPYIESGGLFHRLDRLSSGERSRLQLILRTASLMTSQSLILIDEIELHLHPVWQHKLMDSLIRLVKQYDGLRIIYTTHSKELVERGLKLSHSLDSDIIASHQLI